jgi:hypothetical protein
MIVLGTQTASIERELAVDPNDGTAVARMRKRYAL